MDISFINMLSQIQTDVGNIKGAVGSVKATVEAHDKILVNYDEKFETITNTLLRIESHANSRFESHHQWVEQEIKKDREFAEREINELNKIIKPLKDDFDVRREKGLAFRKGFWHYTQTGCKYLIGGSIAYFIFGRAVLSDMIKNFLAHIY